jgi:hypothetical protein
MKKAFLLICFIGSINCYGQVDTTSIYSKALKYYNQHLDNSNSKETIIFIETNPGITEILPERIGKRQVKILTWENQKEIYLKNNNKIRHVTIFPARTKDDLLEIHLTPYFGEYKGKKKGYSLEVSDWVVVQFKYDCISNKFQYWDTKTGGI